jgi:diaminopimelate decarboxylase
MLNNSDTNLDYKNNTLNLDNTDLSKLTKDFQTPFFVYSYETLKNNFLKYQKTLEKLDIKNIICFAMKTNSNSTILKEFHNLGAGFDTVSGGEIFKAINAGADPQKIVFAGVGKTKEEIEFAIENNILMFNVESKDELDLINNVAINLNKKVKIAFRVNPNVDPKTHPYISTGLSKNKFGIDILEVDKLYIYASKLEGILPVGIHCHIGSQLLDLSPYEETFIKLFELFEKLKTLDIKIEYLNIGGGLGICYNAENQNTPDPKNLFNDFLISNIKKYNLTLILEPGRSLIGNAGILITKVLYNKQNKSKNFIIVDAGMNDLARPSLYDAYHEISPLIQNNDRKKITADIVGPICESTDFLAKDRLIPEMKQNEYLVIQSAGAYCFSMSSNYNSRLKPAEILIKEGAIIPIRKKDSFKDLLLNEI